MSATHRDAAPGADHPASRRLTARLPRPGGDAPRSHATGQVRPPGGSEGEATGRPSPARVLSVGEVAGMVAELSASYLERPSDARLRRHLRKLLAERAAFLGAGAPDDARREVQMIVTTGETGAGKSTALRRLFQETAELAPSADGRSRPYVRLSVRAPATLRTVGLDLLRVLGYPMTAEARENVVWDRVLAHLRMAETVVLFLDEFQNCSSRANVDEAVRIRDTIKSLLVDDHPIILVLAGLPEIVDFVRVDPQVRRRGRFTSIEAVDAGYAATIGDAIASLAGSVGLSVGDDLQEDVVPRLVHAACGQLGLVMEMAIEAVACALRPVDVVADEEGVEEEVARPPRERLTRSDFARMFEDRTDNMDFANPFVARDWHGIDPTLVGVHLPSQMTPKGGNLPAHARKGRRRGAPR